MVFKSVFDHPDPEPMQVGPACSSLKEIEQKILNNWGRIMLSEEPLHLPERVAGFGAPPLQAE